MSNIENGYLNHAPAFVGQQNNVRTLSVKPFLLLLITAFLCFFVTACSSLQQQPTTTSVAVENLEATMTEPPIPATLTSTPSPTATFIFTSSPTHTPTITPTPEPTRLGGALAYVSFVHQNEAGETMLYIDAFNDILGDSGNAWTQKQSEARPVAPAMDNSPTKWSPDGKMVAFFSEEEGRYYLNTYHLQTQTVNRLVEVPDIKNSVYEEPVQSLSWSPNGNWLVYDIPRQNTDGDVWIFSMIENKSYWIGRGGGPRWSLDGVYIYFQMDLRNLQRATPDGSTNEEITPERIKKPQAGENFLWFSPALEGFVLERQNSETGFFEFLLISLDGIDEEVIVELPVKSIARPSWEISPDGRWITLWAVPANRDQAQLFFVNIAEKRYITDLSYDKSGGRIVSWSPNGKGLVIFRVFVWLVEIETGNQQHFFVPPITSSSVMLQAMDIYWVLE